MKQKHIELYLVLGFQESDLEGDGPTQEQIKANYKRLAKEHHPDKGGSPEMMGKISMAYSILGKAESRKKYDEEGMPAQESSDLGRILQMLGAFIDQTLVDVPKMTMQQLAQGRPPKVTMRSFANTSFLVELSKTIAEARKEVLDTIAEARSDKGQLEATKKQLRYQAGRKKTPGRAKDGKGRAYSNKNDFIGSILDDRIDTCNKALEAGERLLDDINVLFDMLDNYEFLTQYTPQPFQGGGNEFVIPNSMRPKLGL